MLLDGKPVESLDRQAYYASLAHVSCETFLFRDTIRANFLLANPHAAEEEMWRALALVRLDGLVRERGGLDFVLNEDAADISGGQKQRLALAVNLTAPKRIYILTRPPATSMPRARASSWRSSAPSAPLLA